SSFIIARVRVDGQGRPAGSDGAALAAGNFAAAVETTYRVSDWVKRSKTAASFFAKDLESANGLNIEGVAVLDKTIWFGLRAAGLYSAAPFGGGDVARFV